MTIESTNTYEMAGLYAFVAVNGSAVLKWVEKDLQQMFSAAKRDELDLADDKKYRLCFWGAVVMTNLSI